jgi:hypothetical protein
MIDDYYELPVANRKSKQPVRNNYSSLYGNLDRKNQDFRCMHCHNYVSAEAILAGVHNRNHCPYCLWSKHMDLFAAGDRLAACKAPMQPVGLTLKRIQKKYLSENQGELMLIHQCGDCARLSINRIAADDDNDLILAIFEHSFTMDRTLRAQIEAMGIRALSESGREIVLTRLFGQVMADGVQ